MHVIRLRGPWKFEALARGGVRCTRRFNAPSNLAPHQHVWLAFEGIDRAARVTLNGQSLGTLRGSAEAQRLDITPHLAPHNILEVEVTLAAEEVDEHVADAPFGEVRLEIDDA